MKSRLRSALALVAMTSTFSNPLLGDLVVRVRSADLRPEFERFHGQFQIIAELPGENERLIVLDEVGIARLTGVLPATVNELRWSQARDCGALFSLWPVDFSSPIPTSPEFRFKRLRDLRGNEYELAIADVRRLQVSRSAKRLEDLVLVLEAWESTCGPRTRTSEYYNPDWSFVVTRDFLAELARERSARPVADWTDDFVDVEHRFRLKLLKKVAEMGPAASATRQIVVLNGWLTFSRQLRLSSVGCRVLPNEPIGTILEGSCFKDDGRKSQFLEAFEAVNAILGDGESLSRLEKRVQSIRQAIDPESDQRASWEAAARTLAAVRNDGAESVGLASLANTFGMLVSRLPAAEN